MTKMTSKRLKDKKVPNLRFPGFEGEWETKKLGEIGEIVNGLTYSPNDIDENGVLVLRSSNVQNRSLAFQDNVYVRTDNYNPVQENDILICVRNGSKNLIGKNALINKKNEGVAFGAFMSIYRSSFNRFLFHWFDTNEYKEIVHKNLGATINSINGSDLKNFKVPFPSVKEQKKIASFLSLVDERIQTQNKIIEELETLKTSISKKIFSRELRFKNNNGSKFPEWINKRFREIATIIMGQSPESTSYNIEGIGLPLIQGNADIVNRLSAPRQYTKNPTKQCDIGDILLTVRAPVGYVSKSSHNACIGRGICSVKNNKHSSNEFIYQFLLYFENKWKSLEQGSTFTSVNSSDIGSIIIKVPCIEEQKKIADFLHGIDSKISTEKILLQKLEEQKKYLLDNLFV
ncbi:restriction endonuclease subunit S [Myroides odoratus]|uniref:restriction endonuclease subunit S n=1 Tax=Myroides odoratus TaxID=256 RepID=UPI000765F7C3|nr:restriction endonuclease subunit S [Myroides odoratus]